MDGETPWNYHCIRMASTLDKLRGESAVQQYPFVMYEKCTFMVTIKLCIKRKSMKFMVPPVIWNTVAHEIHRPIQSLLSTLRYSLEDRWRSLAKPVRTISSAQIVSLANVLDGRKMHMDLRMSKKRSPFSFLGPKSLTTKFLVWRKNSIFCHYDRHNCKYTEKKDWKRGLHGFLRPVHGWDQEHSIELTFAELETTLMHRELHYRNFPQSISTICTLPGIRWTIVRVRTSVVTRNLSANGSRKLPAIDRWLGNRRAINPSSYKKENEVTQSDSPEFWTNTFLYLWSRDGNEGRANRELIFHFTWTDVSPKQIRWRFSFWYLYMPPKLTTGFSVFLLTGWA